jgi:peptide/nickel transport system ATP-binding protein
MNQQNDILLKVLDLAKYYPVKCGFFDTMKGLVRAVDGISFQVRKGITFGLVGESGCGKTTTGRMIVRVLQPTTGEIWYYDESSQATELIRCTGAQMHPLRRQIQMIFQDPYGSLDPRMTILNIVGEPLRANRIAVGIEYKDRVAESLAMVGLRPEYMNRYPHSFSGGQRQRIGIARALVTQPRLVVADEPVSALDVSVQAQILNLLQDLQIKFDLTFVFIAHDLSVIRHICDRIAVMYMGKLVEVADRPDLFSRPGHPYTEVLLSIIPRMDPGKKTKPDLFKGTIAEAGSLPSGCSFHPRCRHACDMCRTIAPPLREITAGHQVACHYNLNLEGI